jgi:hypothetical protein
MTKKPLILDIGYDLSSPPNVRSGREHPTSNNIDRTLEAIMCVNEALRAMAGIVVLVSLALGYWVSPYWYLFTAFVGLNLLQSAFTGWCPAMTIFRKLGLREN